MLKKSIPFVIAMLLLASMTLVLFSCGYDYAQTVKNYTPFTDEAFGFTKTADCGTVIGKYVESPEWKARTDGGTEYVDVKGKLKGSGEDLLLTFKLTPTGEKDMFLIETYAIDYDGEKKGADEAAMLLYYMSAAYEGGLDTVQAYIESFDPDAAG
jgi:hypothetical protein